MPQLLEQCPCEIAGPQWTNACCCCGHTRQVDICVPSRDAEKVSLSQFPTRQGPNSSQEHTRRESVPTPPTQWRNDLEAQRPILSSDARIGGTLPSSDFSRRIWRLAPFPAFHATQLYFQSVHRVHKLRAELRCFSVIWQYIWSARSRQSSRGWSCCWGWVLLGYLSRITVIPWKLRWRAMCMAWLTFPNQPLTAWLAFFSSLRRKKSCWAPCELLQPLHSIYLSMCFTAISNVTANFTWRHWLHWPLRELGCIFILQWTAVLKNIVMKRAGERAWQWRVAFPKEASKLPTSSGFLVFKIYIHFELVNKLDLWDPTVI